ncbi:MAG: type II secretion system protein [Candidatus Cloacimonetes bacterium]|nr:type II secretion system protein [Candidatus Cloacimonadota bacterium]
MLKKQRGFTIVEIVVSISIFVLILTVGLNTFYSARHREKNSEKGLEYYLLASKLNYFLKNDLRAIYRSKVGKVRGEDRYSLYISYETKSGKIQRKPITYKFDSSAKKVERIDDLTGKTMVFNFSETLEKEEEFKFAIFAKEIESEYEAMHEFAHLAKITW